MVMAFYFSPEDYWETFTLQDEDIEFLYNYLLELETPLTSRNSSAHWLTSEFAERSKPLSAAELSRASLLTKEGYTLQQNWFFLL